MSGPRYATMTIPKGTVLFRGIDNTAKLTSDFAGVLTKGKFCLHDNYNVFFYPFPFVSMSIAKYEYTCIHVTTRDLTLLNLILPSKFNRADRTRGIGGIKTCSNMKFGCDLQGYAYDPCVDYSIVPKDVAGMVAIAQDDAYTVRTNPRMFASFFNTYFTTYKDSRGTVGVPEFVLHPLIEKVGKQEQITDFKAWYSANKSKFNYNYLHIFKSTDITVTQNLMDEFLSKKGLDLGDEEPYHLKMNKKTGFFQVVELSNNLEELISPDFKSIKKSPDLVLTRKNIYKLTGPKFLSDKYPKADTIPGSLNDYNKSRHEVRINYTADDWLRRFTDNPKHKRNLEVKKGPLYIELVDNYLINGKTYGFFLTPKGEDMLKEDMKTNPSAFDWITTRNRPFNNYVSAYLINPPKPGESYAEVTNIPAPEINGLLVHYAKKKGSLGASRRRTLRRSWIPNLLKTR